MIKKIAIILFASMVIFGCSKKESEDISYDEYAFEIVSEGQSYSYPSLNILKIVTEEQEELTLLVPSEYYRTYDGFTSLEVFNGSWQITISEKLDAVDFLEGFEPFTENCYDSGVVSLNNYHMRFLKDLDDNYVSFLYIMDAENSVVLLELNYSEEYLDSFSLDILKELKDVYSMEVLELPEDIEYEIVEEITDYEEIAEEPTIPQEEILE